MLSVEYNHGHVFFFHVPGQMNHRAAALMQQRGKMGFF